MQPDLGCVTEKLKEPADLLKYYSSKYAWMTAKVFGIVFAMKSPLRQEERESFQTGRGSVMKSLEIKPIIHIQSSLPLPAPRSPSIPSTGMPMHTSAPHMPRMLRASCTLLEVVFNLLYNI